MLKAKSKTTESRPAKRGKSSAPEGREYITDPATLPDHDGSAEPSLGMTEGNDSPYHGLGDDLESDELEKGEGGTTEGGHCCTDAVDDPDLEPSLGWTADGRNSFGGDLESEDGLERGEAGCTERDEFGNGGIPAREEELV